MKKMFSLFFVLSFVMPFYASAEEDMLFSEFYDEHLQETVAYYHPGSVNVKDSIEVIVEISNELPVNEQELSELEKKETEMIEEFSLERKEALLLELEQANTQEEINEVLKNDEQRATEGLEKIKERIEKERNLIQADTQTEVHTIAAAFVEYEKRRDTVFTYTHSEIVFFNKTTGELMKEVESEILSDFIDKHKHEIGIKDNTWLFLGILAVSALILYYFIYVRTAHYYHRTA